MIDLVTILRFFTFKILFVNRQLVNSKLPENFKIQDTIATFHVIPSLNISSRLEQTVSSWMKKKERKRRRGILSRMKTRRSKKHVVRNIDMFTESGDLADQCRVLHSRSHILYEAISLPGLEGRIRRFTNSFQFLISGSRLNFFGRWMDEEIRGMIINFEQGGNIGCNDILIIFVQESSNNVNSNYNYFRLLLRIIGE